MKGEQSRVLTFKHRRTWKFFGGALIIQLLLLVFWSVQVFAFHQIQSNFDYDRQNTYWNYYEKNKVYSKPEVTIEIPGAGLTYKQGDIKVLHNFQGKEEVLVWTDRQGMVEWEIEVPESGLYQLGIMYYPLVDLRGNIELKLAIDGEVPFNDVQQILLPRAWRDAGQVQQDNRGNDIRPQQEMAPCWLFEVFQDKQGIYVEPYQFYLSAGKHRLTITAIKGNFAIDHLLFYNQQIPTYAEVVEEYKAQGYQPADSVFLKIQAEKAELKSEPLLHGLYDRSSPATEPSHHVNLRLNTIGGSNWNSAGQWITWKVDIPEDGLYQLGMRFRQNYLRGFFVTRKLYIDGRIPFQELADLTFDYSPYWQMKVIGDQTPHLVYLTKGVHEIKMEVGLGKLADTLRVMQDVVYEMNLMYRKIIMITGINPDIYRDYNLEKEIPALVPTFVRLSQTLTREAEKLEGLSGRAGGEVSFLKEVAFQLKSLSERPETIKERLDNYRSNVSSLSAWVLQMKAQPLELDYIFVSSPDQQAPRAEAGFFGKLIYAIKSFIASFYMDYSAVGDVYEKDQSIKVWIGTGRDQAQVLKSLIDELFTPQTGIKVNLELVQGALIEATLAGQGPDIALSIGRKDPVNLAIRNALLDLSQFDDFETVMQRFMPGALLPYQYENGYYALPETQLFNMMFYRKDIFAELGILPPETWDEFLTIVPVIQRNNMQVGLPQEQSGNERDLPIPQMFVTLLFQNGGEFYAADRKSTLLNNPEAIKAFRDWTEFYTQYNFPLRYDFYNRFRTGEMPLAIQPYTEYNRLSVAAPEIANLWGMLPVPGLRQADGTINRVEAATGNACVILKQVKEPDAAWEFLKWWTSAEVQKRFGLGLETLMGPAARYPTANVAAFSELPWSVQEYENLMNQWRNVREIPEVPGGYYAARGITNAFREAVYDYRSPRAALFDHNRTINEEIMRKRIEFGLE